MRFRSTTHQLLVILALLVDPLLILVLPVVLAALVIQARLVVLAVV
jgi:hypothetical protein